jgi:hypothetical protein
LIYNPQTSNPYLNTNTLGLAPEAPVINEPSLKFFYILLGLEVFRSLTWLVINKLLYPRLIRDGDFVSFFEIYNWSFNILWAVLVISFIAIAKNRAVKVFLSIYGAVSLLIILAFQFWPNSL